MTAEHQQTAIPPEQWPELLTPDLREHFERIGEELVSHDVAAHNYSTPAKHFAALHWLGQKRIARDQRETGTARLALWTLIVAMLTFLAAAATIGLMLVSKG